MKKFLAVVLAAALCLTFCACGSLVKGLKENAESAVRAADTAKKEDAEAEAKAAAALTEEKSEETAKAEKSAVRTKPVKAETASGKAEKPAEKKTGKKSTQKKAAETAAAEAAPLKQSGESRKSVKPSSVKTTETITPVISAAKYAYNPVRVTKSPTGETVYEGGSASFIAYAENATCISWLIVNPNGRDFVEASALAQALPGLSISGTASSTLTIGCIPASLDGWYIQAKFTGEGGPVHSSMARLTVWRYPVGTAVCDPRSCCGGDPWSCDPWTPGRSCNPWSCDPRGGCWPPCGAYDPWSAGGWAW